MQAVGDCERAKLNALSVSRQLRDTPHHRSPELKAALGSRLLLILATPAALILVRANDVLNISSVVRLQ
jgi:hypothetical protein